MQPLTTSMLLVSAFMLGACSNQPTSNNSVTAADKAPATIGMANPAATFCIEMGGQYQIIDTPEGQAGRCLYQNQQWDAWELYRAHHPQPKHPATERSDN